MAEFAILVELPLLVGEPVHEVVVVLLKLVPADLEHLEVLEPLEYVTRGRLVAFVHLTEALIEFGLLVE